VAAEVLEEARAFAKELSDKKVELSIKTGEGGRSFGSVSTKEIAAAAKEQLGYDIDKKKLQLSEPIKSPGIFEVPLKLHPKVTGSLKVQVSEQ
jgi:large subunit ribosomal protein L9